MQQPIRANTEYSMWGKYRTSKSELNMMKVVRLFFSTIVPTILIFSYFAQNFWPEYQLILRNIFFLCLASSVGYYTNFIAIKMLFRPKEKSFLGRQGLIPRNQKKLAQALGEGISEHFFSPKDIVQYFRQQKLIEQASETAKSKLEMWVSDPEIQKKISLWLSKQINANQSLIEEFLKSYLNKDFITFLQQKIDLEDLAETFTQTLETKIKSGEINIEQLVDKVAYLAAEQIPIVSQFLYGKFEQHIENQAGIKKGLAKLLHWSSDLNEEDLREKLFQLIASFEFRQGVYDTIIKLFEHFNEYLKTEHGIEESGKIYTDILDKFLSYLNTTGIPALSNWLEKLLVKPEVWSSVSHVISLGIGFFHKELSIYFNSSDFDKQLNNFLPKLLNYFNIAEIIENKASQYDTENLEKLVLKTTGEHLVMIEILGGILGGFAGIAFINVHWFLLTLLLIIGVVSLDQLLSYFRFKNQN